MRMIICKTVIYLSVLLSWRSASYFLGFKIDQSQRHTSHYSLLMLKSDSAADVGTYLDALRFPSERIKVCISGECEEKIDDSHDTTRIRRHDILTPIFNELTSIRFIAGIESINSIAIRTILIYCWGL